MKPFDINLAKQGHPVCTRDGKEARVICFNKSGVLPIVYLYQSNDGDECVSVCDIQGKAFMSDGSIDLMMASEKKEGWIKIYKRDDGVSYTGGTIYKTEELARKFVPDALIDTIKIEWEE